jgi:hypothetical protein
MDKETTYLIDEIIRYSLDRKITLKRATGDLAELAKQRLPEYGLETGQRAEEDAIHRKVVKAKAHSIVMRVPIRSWVHEVSWRYYPSFHVIGNAVESYAFPVRANIETWPPVSERDTTYLDNIYFDPDAGRFWQPEPFLTGMPVSKRVYKHITSAKLERLRGTAFLKVSPAIMGELLRTRRGHPSYEVKRCDVALSSRHRPHGSRGWKDRMSGVNRYWSRRRKTEWTFSRRDEL